MIFQNWGATPEEIAGPVVGDDVCPDARVIATRSITISAPPDEVFAWIRQMGFGRAGWYSYDWIDNLGRTSARTIRPEWQDVHSGSTIPGGPIDFEAVIVDPPRSFVLRVVPTGRMSGRLCFTLAYELREFETGTRLVTRMRSRVSLPGGAFIDRFLLGPGDGIMVRKQLRTLRNRVYRHRQLERRHIWARSLLSRFGYTKRIPTRTAALTGLLHSLHPVRTQFPLIRLGASGDGGYLVPDDLDGIVACFSPGVGRISVFERDCAARAMRVFMADGSVDRPALDDPAVTFLRQHIGIVDRDDQITLETWIDQADLPADGDLLLQMDIEGAEWSALTNLSTAHLRRFRIIVVEFHNFDALFDKKFFQVYSPALERLTQDFVVVHLHPNNSQGPRRLNGIELPKTLEMTLHRRDRVDVHGFRTDFPHPLDRDNTREKHFALPTSLYR